MELTIILGEFPPIFFQLKQIYNMRRIFILISIVILSFFYSCKDSNKSRNLFPTIYVNKKNVMPTSNIDSVIDSIDFVVLQTNNLSLIKEISKLMFVGDTIIIGDFKLGKILLFSLEGKLITEISKLGRGPEEYIKIKDITYDKKNKIIIILDIGSRRILRYNLSGKFIDSQKINIANIGTYFEWFNNSFIFYRHNLTFPGHSNHNVIITNQFQEYINSGITIPKPVRNLSFWGNRNMSLSDSTLLILPCFNDTIFSVNKNNCIKPRFIISFDKQLDIKKSQMWNRKFRDIVQFHEFAGRGDYIYQTSDFFSLPNELIFRYFTKKGYSVVLFSKTSGSTKIFQNPTFTIDNFIFRPIGKKRGEIIALLNPTDGVDILNKYLKYPITQNSNPVLCFISMKQ